MALPRDNAARGSAELNLEDVLDMTAFNQVLGLDAPGNNAFSLSIVLDFFSQAEDTFLSMDEALQQRDLNSLASLGHYLKGSSAAVGLIKVRDGCGKIERFGKKQNETGLAEPDTEVCLQRIDEVLRTTKTDYYTAAGVLRKYYGQGDEGQRQ
ncbi:Multistep phosphorelay regulator 1 [Tolypocladium ophioglossoides CBS 100239]|uniref:Multistep phosphorelay regulator 1 n=1 Tax=Tolypocladium ophioglossoides (strain CBS 100239) TaxID=1163406 RepID=A0A0L0NDV9_TOLOC|nr:Multistep phosphorelay regulator 1 [Tolypocladium ophioglossoides CBS 100239]